MIFIEVPCLNNLQLKTWPALRSACSAFPQRKGPHPHERPRRSARCRPTLRCHLEGVGISSYFVLLQAMRQRQLELCAPPGARETRACQERAICKTHNLKFGDQPSGCLGLLFEYSCSPSASQLVRPKVPVKRSPGWQSRAMSKLHARGLQCQKAAGRESATPTRQTHGTCYKRMFTMNKQGSGVRCHNFYCPVQRQ